MSTEAPVSTPPAGAPPPAGTPPPNTPPPANTSPANTPPPAPVASTKFSDYLNEDGSLKEGWHKTVKGAPDSFKKFTSLESMLGSHANAEKLIGSQNKVAIPQEGASPEEWNAYYNKLGRPETPDKYEIAVPEELKGLSISDESLGEYKKVFHEAGLTAKQAKMVTDAYWKTNGGVVAQLGEQREQQRQMAESTLIKEWGGEDAYKANIGHANRYVQSLGLTQEFFQKNPEIGNNPEFVKAMFKAAQRGSEAPAAGTRESAPAGGKDSLIQERIANSKALQTVKRGTSEHQRLLERQTWISEQLSGEQKRMF